MIAEGLENKERKEMPADIRSIVKTYSCNDADRDCTMNNYHILHFYDGLDEMDLNHPPVSSTDTSVSESESVPNVIIKFYHLGRVV